MEQGEVYLNPPLFDIERSFEDSTSATPLIFILPGADPLKALTAFAKRKGKLELLTTISLG
jgi:dynein heavy chain